MVKEHVISVDNTTSQGLEKLKSFLLDNFKVDNIWYYLHDDFAAYNGRIEEEPYDPSDERIAKLKEKYPVEDLEKYGTHMLHGGKTIEEKVDKILEYIKSGYCTYINLHDSDPITGNSSASISVQINGGYSPIDDLKEDGIEAVVL